MKRPHGWKPRPEFTACNLQELPHDPTCDLRINDIVTCMNEYGATWEATIIGFRRPPFTDSHGEFLPDRFIHVISPGGAYWFPHKLSEITLLQRPEPV